VTLKDWCTIVGTVGRKPSSSFVPRWAAFHAATVRIVFLVWAFTKGFVTEGIDMFHVLPPAYSIAQFVDVYMPTCFKIAKRRIEEAHLRGILL